jgi:hypothetical protein
VSVPTVNPNFQFNLRLISNSHRITFFAHPYTLTPIESYSCKKQGEGCQSRAISFRMTSLHAGTPATPIPSLVYFITRGHPGWRGHSSLRNLSALCVSALSLFRDFQVLALSLEGSTARPERRRRSTLRTRLHPQEATQRPFAKNAKIDSYLGGDSVSTEAVAARRHAGTHLPVTWWKLEMPTTTWHLLLN